MNELEAIETILEEKELSRLVELVEEAKKKKSQTFNGYASSLDKTITALGLLGFINIDIYRSESEYHGLYGPPLKRDDSEAVYTLFPAAYYRYNYEKLPGLFKPFKKIILKWNNALTILAFGISLFLMILRIIEVAEWRLILDWLFK